MRFRALYFHFVVDFRVPLAPPLGQIGPIFDRCWCHVCSLLVENVERRRRKQPNDVTLRRKILRPSGMRASMFLFSSLHSHVRCKVCASTSHYVWRDWFLVLVSRTTDFTQRMLTVFATVRQVSERITLGECSTTFPFEALRTLLAIFTVPR